MLRITVENSQQSEEFTLPHGKRAELGRLVTAADGVLDVWLKDSACSRNQLRLTELPDGTVLLENLSANVSIQRPSCPPIAPLGELSLACPFSVSAGATTVSVDRIAAPVRGSLRQSESTASSLHAVEQRISPTQFWSGKVSKPDAELSQESLLDWFSALIAVQRSAAGSTDFYREIADATVELVELDYSLVLLRSEGRWSCVAANGVDQSAATWSETVVQQTIHERRTFHGPLDDLGPVQSLAALDAVVAAPILSVDDLVVGVIYGARKVQPENVSHDTDSPTGVSALQAQLVQLLAASAATGLARAEKEAEAARFRGQFEDFCSPELVRELHNNPRLLEPSERSVTVMFCDIRGFTRLCDQLSPSESNVITTQILDQIAECILRFEGLIIDFHGDGIAAMWNAPCVQHDHSRQAVNCAAQIQRNMSRLRTDSQNPVQRTLKVGIGIHTGMALVGNVGGSRRLKYGPRGTTVNMASRIEGVTKHLGVDVLLSADTALQANVELPEGRRIGRFQLAGTDNTVELFQYLGRQPVQYSPEDIRRFETAVGVFESGSFQDADELLKAYLASISSAGTDSVADVLIKEIEKRSRNPNETHPSHIQFHTK
ncbi:MAG: adenylate/guanylate cyclase domain-containing protein [Fuerstiella sp.]|nr:adenylate/guanylate cyclase domain-containing protein [Fuerstiella sp.]MCP4854774.1 adenylate/guanylate cyclase domain-containing protein [Fuerstiella sp.]